MHKEETLREIRWDINPDRTVAGAFFTFDMFLVEDDGSRTPIGKSTRDATADELKEFSDQSAFEASTQIRDAHKMIASHLETINQMKIEVSDGQSEIQRLQDEVRRRDAVIESERLKLSRLVGAISDNLSSAQQ